MGIAPGVTMSTLALNGHSNATRECPLLGVKRTSLPHRKMSANDPMRTSARIRFTWLTPRKRHGSMSESGHQRHVNEVRYWLM